MAALENLMSDDFLLNVNWHSTGEALYDHLAESGYVASLRREIASSATSNEQIEQFVRELLRDFRRGAKFPWDTTIAAVAVALRYVPGDFATRFLGELSALRVAEIPLAPRVSAIALAQRREHLAGETIKCVSFRRAPVVGARRNLFILTSSVESTVSPAPPPMVIRATNAIA